MPNDKINNRDPVMTGGRILKSGMVFMKIFRCRTSLLLKGGMVKTGFQWRKEVNRVAKVSGTNSKIFKKTASIGTLF